MDNSNELLQLETVQVDAFIDPNPSKGLFSGNPAEVVFLIPSLATLSEEAMLDIAAENNLSETAFVSALDSSISTPSVLEQTNEFNLRWFTPTREVDLCGHATLATAWALFNVKKNASKSLTFHTKSGKLTVERNGDELEMVFPRNVPVPVIRSSAQEAGDVTGLSIEQVEPILNAVFEETSWFESGGKNDGTQDAVRIVGIAHSSRTRKLVVEIEPCGALELVRPNINNMIAAHDGSHVRGVIVTCKSDKVESGLDFESRYFAPWNGIDEDPVTGSAHTVLGPYWAGKLGAQGEETVMHAKQSSKRGGVIRVELKKNEPELIHLSGRGLLVRTGTMYIPKRALC